MASLSLQKVLLLTEKDLSPSAIRAANQNTDWIPNLNSFRQYDGAGANITKLMKEASLVFFTFSNPLRKDEVVIVKYFPNVIPHRQFKSLIQY